MKKIIAQPHRLGAFLFILAVFSILPMTVFVAYGVIMSKNIKIHAASPTIDITAGAVQTAHQGGVPHTDLAGNFKLTPDSNSLLPIGIYNPTLCQVTKTLNWPAGSGGVPGWNGEYRVKVNYGTSRAPGTYLIADINVGSGLIGTVGNLPPVSQLHYSVWQNGTNAIVDERDFISDPCSSSAEDNNYQSIKNAGYNMAILEDYVYPDANVLAKAQASGLKLILDMRDRPASTFANLKDNPNVVGFYVDDDGLAVAHANNVDPTSVYTDVKAYSDSLDGQTQKVVLGAEPDIDTTSPANFSWQDWYNRFDAIGNVSFHYNYPKTATSNSIFDQVKAVQHQVQVNGDTRPSWFISQAINLKWRINLEFPTQQEIRAMAYSSFIHGATGLFQFSYDGWPRRQPKHYDPAGPNAADINWWDRHAGIKALTPFSYPGGDNGAYPASTVADRGAYDATSTDVLLSIADWNALDASQNGVNAELNNLKGVLLSKTATDQYKVYVDQAPISAAPIRTMLKYYQGQYYLLAVNIDNTTVNAKFSFPGKNFTKADVLNENRTVSIQSGTDIIDAFSPFAVHVYKLSNVSTGSWSAQYFNNPDFTNLALERNETKINLVRGDSTKSPDPLVLPDTFSIIWRGNFNFNTQKYRFNASGTNSQDNVKIYLDNSTTPIIDATGGASLADSKTLSMVTGVHLVSVFYSHGTGTYSIASNFVDAVTCFDVNGDYVPNSIDLGIVSQHFNQHGTDLGWDVNNDTVVNSIDIGMISQHFNQHC